MLNELKPGEVKSFTAEAKVNDFILKWYKAFSNDKVLKDQQYRCLGNINLNSLWQISEDNYNVILPIKKGSDWKRQAKRTITRDQANIFISRLSKKLIFPQIIAQNKNQNIDIEASRIFRVLLEHWERICKSFRLFVDAVHSCVVFGTVHIQQDIVNGREERSVVPNDEIFIPNFKQPDIQKQSHLIRAQITSYEEAKMIYGDNDNWQYVVPGGSQGWSVKSEMFENYESGIENNDEVLIIYVWEHMGYDDNNKPKPKKYNVLINGVPMFDIENELSLKHNLYNISKTVFEKFANVLFYWGNSLPNKIRHDQSYLDAFRSILINKQILNLLPPLFNKGQEHIDEDVIVPAKITPTQLEKGDIFKVDGIGDPITMADYNMELTIERQVQQGTTPPIVGEEQGRTLGEIQLKDTRASELLEIFGNMISFLVEDMAEQSLSNIIQFELKKNINKLVDGAKMMFSKPIDIGEQSLTNGETGTLSLNFTPKEQHPSSMDLASKEFEHKKKTGQNIEIIHIDPKYFEELDKLIYVSANPVDRPSDALDRLMTIETYNTVYKGNPEIDQKEAVREVIRVSKGDESRLLAKPQPIVPGAIPGQPGAPGAMTPPTTRMRQALSPNIKPAMV